MTITDSRLIQALKNRLNKSYLFENQPTFVTVYFCNSQKWTDSKESLHWQSNCSQLVALVIH